jgi:quercetin dioxygenase-like cupin family protein
MANNLIADATLKKHPVHEGVYIKHFFGKEDNDRLNNLEIVIAPGSQIPPHAHDSSTEFFYMVSGQGVFLDNDEWKAIKKGDAFRATVGMKHSIKNTGKDALVLFSTFSPAIW